MDNMQERIMKVCLCDHFDTVGSLDGHEVLIKVSAISVGMVLPIV